MSTPNPYAAPRAVVADAVSPQQGNFVPGGHGVPAGNGWSWIVQGWKLFMRQPWMWILTALVLGVILIVLIFIPFIGAIAFSILFPIFMGGLMAGCRALDNGAELELGQLFAGFRDRAGPLAAVGAIYLGLSIVIALVVGIITGVSMFAAMSDGAADAAATLGALASMALAILVMLALMIPVLMAVWFAAPLIMFHEHGAVEAMKESFSGCLKNVVPFLLYGLILLIPVIVATPLFLAWLVLGPVLAASVYTAYRDIYFTA